MNDQMIIQKTTDYSIFKSFPGNRSINRVHVERLKHSFEKKYLISPIECNEHMQVIDGQHRLQAAKELGLEIYYFIIKGYGIDEIQILNANTINWTKNDYLNNYVNQGKDAYIKFKCFRESYPEFSFSSCEALLANNPFGSKGYNIKNYGSYRRRYFEEGDLIIENYEKSCNAADKLLALKNYYNSFNRMAFVRTMIQVFSHSGFDFDIFLSKVKANPSALKPCVNISQYKQMIEEIYNRYRKDKINLRY